MPQFNTIQSKIQSGYAIFYTGLKCLFKNSILRFPFFDNYVIRKLLYLRVPTSHLYIHICGTITKIYIVTNKRRAYCRFFQS